MIPLWIWMGLLVLGGIVAALLQDKLGLEEWTLETWASQPGPLQELARAKLEKR